MKPRVYVETSVLSYLTARPSKDPLTVSRQRITIDWWATRSAFEAHVSEVVLSEASMGDKTYAGRRVDAAKDLLVLTATDESEKLTRALLKAAALPRKAAVDAIHVAIATVYGMDYLVTWNCAHIANAVMRPRIEAVCRRAGFDPPIICTPEELRLGEG